MPSQQGLEGAQERGVVVHGEELRPRGLVALDRLAQPIDHLAWRAAALQEAASTSARHLDAVDQRLAPGQHEDWYRRLVSGQVIEQSQVVLGVLREAHVQHGATGRLGRGESAGGGGGGGADRSKVPSLRLDGQSLGQLVIATDQQQGRFVRRYLLATGTRPGPCHLAVELTTERAHSLGEMGRLGDGRAAG